MDTAERNREINGNFRRVKERMFAALQTIEDLQGPAVAEILSQSPEWERAKEEPEAVEIDHYISWFRELGYKVDIQVYDGSDKGVGSISVVVDVGGRASGKKA